MNLKVALKAEEWDDQKTEIASDNFAQNQVLLG